MEKLSKSTERRLGAHLHGSERQSSSNGSHDAIHSVKASIQRALATELAKNSNKQIVLSTMTLLESPAEIQTLRRLCANGELLVEANDLSAVQLMHEQKLPFVAGPAINCYNMATLKVLLKQGMSRSVMPVELSGDC